MRTFLLQTRRTPQTFVEKQPPGWNMRSGGQGIRVSLTTSTCSITGAGFRTGGNPLRDGGLEAAKARLGKARILKHG